MTNDTDVPDGWFRETRLTGIDGPDDLAGGYLCPDCDHFVPIEFADGDSCPACGAGGLIGTVIAGEQEATYLLPRDYDGGDERAVAPVVAVLLLLAITAILTAIIVVVIFG